MQEIVYQLIKSISFSWSFKIMNYEKRIQFNYSCLVFNVAEHICHAGEVRYQREGDRP